MNTLNQENIALSEVVKNLSVIFILAQVIDDEIQEIESKLKKYGAYKLQMKYQVNQLKSASRELRNKYYEKLTPEEMENFIADVDLIEIGIKQIIAKMKEM